MLSPLSSLIGPAHPALIIHWPSIYPWDQLIKLSFAQWTGPYSSLRSTDYFHPALKPNAPAHPALIIHWTSIHPPGQLIQPHRPIDRAIKLSSPKGLPHLALRTRRYSSRHPTERPIQLSFAQRTRPFQLLSPIILAHPALITQLFFSLICSSPLANQLITRQIPPAHRHYLEVPMADLHADLLRHPLLPARAHLLLRLLHGRRCATRRRLRLLPTFGLTTLAGKTLRFAALLELDRVEVLDGELDDGSLKRRI